MNTAALYLIFGFLLPLASSQPTYNDYNDDDSNCQQDGELQELLQKQFSWTKNEMSQLKTLLSQLDSKENVTTPSSKLRDR